MILCAPSSMDLSFIAPAPTSSADLPENIWLDIFGYLSLEEKFRAAAYVQVYFIAPVPARA